MWTGSLLPPGRNWTDVSVVRCGVGWVRETLAAATGGNGKGTLAPRRDIDLQHDSSGADDATSVSGARFTSVIIREIEPHTASTLIARSVGRSRGDMVEEGGREGGSERASGAWQSKSSPDCKYSGKVRPAVAVRPLPSSLPSSSSPVLPPSFPAATPDVIYTRR